MHGVRGQVKLKSFTAEPEALFSYGTLLDQNGKAVFALQPCGVSGNTLLASVKGVTDRNAAELLKGSKLFVLRDSLPATDENEFYIEDLIGLTATTADGEAFGKITSIENYGAGDLVEITTADGETELFAFTHEIFPEIDLDSGKVVIELPEIIGDDEEE